MCEPHCKSDWLNKYFTNEKPFVYLILFIIEITL